MHVYIHVVSEKALRAGLYGILDSELKLEHEEAHPPSVNEESPQYMPPEVIFSCFDFSNIRNFQMQGGGSSFLVPKKQNNTSKSKQNEKIQQESCSKIAYDAYRPESYDIWSIGNDICLMSTYISFIFKALY